MAEDKIEEFKRLRGEFGDWAPTSDMLIDIGLYFWDRLDELSSARTRIDVQLLVIARLREELSAYRDAAEYDAVMEGPKFKGWNRSQLERARKITESRRVELSDGEE